MIGFCPLSSGSKGNAIYFGTKETKILIDCGLSSKAIEKKLSEINVTIDEIDAILISHEHTDHISGLRVLAFKKNIPIFSNVETAKGIVQFFKKTPKFKIFSTGEAFEYRDIQVLPFSISHDTGDPVAFIIEYNGLKIGFCTDLGFVSTLVTSKLMHCDYLYVEANHQPSMVHASNRPNTYKQRVLSRSGHLSNEECAHLLNQVYHPELKHVHLAHLSEECNSIETVLKVMNENLQNKIEMSIAYQDRISKSIVF